MANNCPKCGGSMTLGFTMDETHGGRGPTKWVEGEPERSIWTGLKLRGKRVLAVRADRCLRCGYLESYAPD